MTHVRLGLESESTGSELLLDHLFGGAGAGAGGNISAGRLEHTPGPCATVPGGQTQVLPAAFGTIGGRQSIGRLGTTGSSTQASLFTRFVSSAFRTVAQFSITDGGGAVTSKVTTSKLL